MQKTRYLTSRRLAELGMLAAIASILMFLEFPLPFIPPFYKMGFSELPALIGGFAFGPIAGMIIELIKALIHGMATQTMWVGELASFVTGCALVVPASIIYKRKKSKKHAIIGMSVGTLTMTILGMLFNAYILLPLYAKVMTGGMDAIIGMSKGVNSSINSVASIIVFGVAPFNLLKGIVISLITILIYKKLRLILK